MFVSLLKPKKMSLESTMLCLDSSEWMRNGDYLPSRLEAQQDAASLISSDRTRNNPENTVGILSMASKGAQLLTSPTEDIGKILASLARIEIEGSSDFSTGIQVAQLALKHRKNKNGGQRIIIFVGSPFQDTIESVQKLGKQLKKNNIAIDIVNIGECDENSEILNELLKAANSNDNSHLITIPAGVSPLDALMSSPLMHQNIAFGGGNLDGSGTGADNFGNIDPSLEPELAMALRVSAEEARAREEARSQSSMDESVPIIASSTSSADVDELDEDALMQRALQLSMMDAIPTSGNNDATPNNASSAVLTDSAFVDQLLQTVDADLNDPLIQAALNQIQDKSAEDPSKKSKNPDRDT